MNVQSTGPVVLAVDGTTGSRGALAYATREAALRDATLHVVHVIAFGPPMSPLQPVTPIDLEPYGRAVVEQAVRDVLAQEPDLTVTTTLARDSRVHAIVEASSGAQLLVLGRETRHGLERLLTGTTTAGVAARAGCPVVAVPEGWSQRVGTPKVVVGVRSEADARDLLTAAYAWAEQRGGTVTAVHAWELADGYLDRIEVRTHAAEWEEIGRRTLTAALADWEGTPAEALTTSVVRHGQTAAVLAAESRDADLLMVRRAHQHRPWDHLGGTIRSLLLAGPVPVEVVPTRGDPDIPGLVLEESGALAR